MGTGPLGDLTARALNRTTSDPSFADIILHIGDIGYNLVDDNVADDFK
jgi:hypothetical protein